MKEQFQESNTDQYIEVEQEKVEKIENLPLDDWDKTHLLLLLCGSKQAIDVTANEQKEIQQEVETALHDLGLSLLKDERYQSKNVKEEFYILAKTENDAIKWRKASQIYDPVELGKLSGYPYTAIENFSKAEKEVIPWKTAFKEKEELPKDIQNEDFMAFLNFRLSQDHWQEELEAPKKWAAVIKETDPPLYTRTVRWYEDYKSKRRRV